MSQPKSTYHHYPSFARRYIRSLLGIAGLPKKGRHEEDMMRMIVQSHQVIGSINGEVLLLEWLHRQQGRVVVPEPRVSHWLQSTLLSRVEGNSWCWPYEFSTISVPTTQTFAGHQVNGVMVAWVDSTLQPERFKKFIHAHGGHGEVDMPHVGGQWLIVAIHNPFDDQPSVDPSILRVAFRPEQITDFINSEALQQTKSGARLMGSEETNILNAVVRWVLSLGMYLSAYPEAISSGVPEWLKNKHPDARHGVKMTKVGYDNQDRELKASMLSPRSVSPHWRQLRDERFYRGEKWSSMPRGSRYILVSGYDVGAEQTVGVGNMQNTSHG